MRKLSQTSKNIFHLFFNVPSSFIEFFLGLQITRITLNLTGGSHQFLASITKIFDALLYVSTYLENKIN